MNGTSQEIISALSSHLPVLSGIESIIYQQQAKKGGSISPSEFKGWYKLHGTRRTLKQNISLYFAPIWCNKMVSKIIWSPAFIFWLFHTNWHSWASNMGGSVKHPTWWQFSVFGSSFKNHNLILYHWNVTH